MSEVQSDGKPSRLKMAVWALALAGVAALLYVMGASLFKSSEKRDLFDLRGGALAKLEVPGRPKPKHPRFPEMDQGTSPPASPAPDVAFTGPDGKPVKIADFKGKVVVVNLWATWCAPCKVEMPTLAALQAAYAMQPVEVVTISTDAPDKEAEARAFIAANGPLKFYFTPGNSFGFAFTPQAGSRPATIIYDRKGVERGRLNGDTNWNSPEAHDLIERLLDEG